MPNDAVPVMEPMEVGPPADGEAALDVKPLRADAQRNRTRVLAAAEAAFFEEGLAVPLDEIARRAGVGPGTVYRHFPTKEALFEAVYVSRVQRITRYARDLAVVDDPAADDAGPGPGALEASEESGGPGESGASKDASPGEVFFGFLTHMVAEGSDKRVLVDAMVGAGIDISTVAKGVTEGLHAAIGELLTRAQASGEVRSDVGVSDVMRLVGGLSLTAQRQLGGGSRVPDRVLEVVCDGLRTQPPR